jgi:hypothetical protein
MMSTAILMTAGAEQTKMRALPDDRSSQQEGLEGISFAKSFGERVGISTSSQAESTVDDAAKVLQGVKNAIPV